MSIHYSPRIVTDGLVLYLDAANPKSYPGTGTVWKDLTRNGNDCTLVNNPVYSNDNSGNFLFNGSNTYVSVPITGTFEEITFEFHGFFDDPSLNMTAREESAFGDWNSTRVHFGTRWGGAAMHFNVNSSWQTTPPNNLVYGWNHYLLVYDTISNQKKVYLNGILSSSFGTNGNMILGDFRIGVATNLNRYYRGNISEFKIYNRSLSDLEIKQNYNVLKSRYQ